MGKLALILGVLCLALAVTTFSLWRQLRDERGRAGDLRAQTLERTACPIVDMPVVKACDVPATDAPRRSEAVLASSIDADPNLYGRVHRDPAFQSAMVDYQRLDVRQQYAPFFASLELPAEKAEQLTLILAQQRVRGMQGIPKEYTRDQWQRRNEDELRAVLSQTEIDAFARYKQSEATRDQVQALRGELMFTREPLRDDQIEPLVDALQKEESRFIEEIRVFNEGLDRSPAAIRDSERRAGEYFVERESAAIKRKLEAASPTLSRTQWQALERRLAAQQAMTIQGGKLRRLQFELAESLQLDEDGGS